MRSTSLEFPREVLRAFQEFLHQVNTFEKNSIDSIPVIGDDADQKVREIKKELVELVAIFVKRVSSAVPAYEKDADQNLEFIALSFLDERFIRAEWSLSDPWSENPLEKDAFGTRNAGSEVFDRIDGLSSDRIIDRYFALLYFLILNCGFAGKYDPEKDNQKLIQYKETLFAMLEKAFNISEVKARSNLQVAFLDSGSVPRSFLPTQRKFNVVSVLLFVLTLALVQLFWFFKSLPLIEIAEQIVQIGSAF